jgi:hypothetical protein
VIHASSLLGMSEVAGHVDTFAKETECGILDFSCTHHKAVEYYISSLTRCSLITCPSHLIYWYGGYWTCNTRDSALLSSLGYLANLYSGRGRHEIWFYYCTFLSGYVSTGNCTTYMNIGLEAKRRVCAGSPTHAGNCDNKPYLSTCQVACSAGSMAEAECSVPGMTLRSPGQRQQTHFQALGGNDMDGVEWAGVETCTSSPSCRLPDGQTVPFYIAYKVPGSYSYYLLHPKDGKMKWGDLDGINDDSSALGRTLGPL